MAERRETRQKREIENAISKINKLFTAEEIYYKAKDKGIGIATVYRFLKEMEKNREIHAFSCDRRKLYSKKGMAHSHFVCESCGVKKHIVLDKIDFLKKYVDEDLCHVQIELSGICAHCKNKQ
jgi:Fe2+ or Zn2+ uptake regulation protein